MEEALNNLTLYQKVALESDVAEILKAADSDSDVLFRIYYMLKHIPKEVTVPFLAIARELVLLPEDKIDRIVLSISADEFPEWLWLEKSITDIKSALNTCCQDQSSATVRIDKKVIKQNLVRSAFVCYMRGLMYLSSEYTVKMLDAVLEDNELSFLKDLCFSLKREVEEIGEVTNLKKPDDLFKAKIDCKMGLITYTEETKTLERLIKLERNPRQFFNEVKAEQASIKVKEDNSNGDLVALKQMQQILDTVIAQVQGKREELKEEIKDVTYVVSKAFKSNPSEKSTLREFKTASEAKAFVKNMEAQFPELLTTCDFIISEKKDNGRKEV